MKIMFITETVPIHSSTFVFSRDISLDASHTQSEVNEQRLLCVNLVYRENKNMRKRSQ